MIQTRQIACTACKTEHALPLSMRDPMWMVCSSCGLEHKRNPVDNTWSATEKKYQINNDYWAVLPGATGVIEDKPFIVAGATELTDADGNLWHEYLAVADDGTRYFFSETDGHWVLINEFDMNAKTQDRYQYNGNRVYDLEGYAAFEQIYDYKPLPGKCAGFFDYDIEAETFCSEYIRPPELFIREKRGGVVDFFYGRYLPKAELKTALGDQVQVVPGRGIGVVQPFPIDTANFYRILCGFAVLILLIYGVDSVSNRNEIVYSGVIDLSDTTTIKTVVSPSFDLQGSRSRLTFKFIATRLENQWIAEEISLINDVTQVERSIGIEASRYSGSDSDGYWEENQENVKAIFCGIDPGRYHLEITPSKAPNDFGPHQLRLEAIWQAHQTANLVMALVLTGLAILICFISSYFFEVARWSHSPYSKYNTES